MRLLATATLFFCLLAQSAFAQPAWDDRYPSWGNRMTGFQKAKEPRWDMSRPKASKRQAKPKNARVSPARRQMAPHRAYIGSHFIRGRLVCAVNVNAALAARGVKGTGSALAKSFLRWGRPTPPVPGAVAVFGRRGGGHVAIVHSVNPNGTVIYANPSSRRQQWVVGPYRARPIAFRVAG